MNENVKYATIDLTMRQIYARKAMSGHMIAKLPMAKLATYLDAFVDDLFATLSAHVLGHETGSETFTETLVTEQPESWWQAFKLSAIEWGNPFFDPDKVRIKQTAHTVTVKATAFTAFPELPFVAPDNWGAHVQMWVQA